MKQKMKYTITKPNSCSTIIHTTLLTCLMKKYFFRKAFTKQVEIMQGLHCFSYFTQIECAQHTWRLCKKSGIIPCIFQNPSSFKIISVTYGAPGIVERRKR